MASKAWRLFLETSEDIQRIRLLEPCYWFVFLNLALTTISSNFDYPYAFIALIIQLALSVWFAISMAWIVQSCHHKMAISHESLFIKGRTVKFCYRCGTRLPRSFHADPAKDFSWQTIYFQVPPHLFDYISFWVTLSAIVMIVFFLILKFLKTPDLQHIAVLAAVILVILVPPILYFFGRFRKYLSDTKGLIWWSDIKVPFLIWLLLVAALLGLLHFL